MGSKGVLVGALLIVLWIGVAYLNTHTDELLVMLPGALVASALVGIVQPRGAWRWGVLLGLAVPVSAAVALLLGVPVPYPNDWANVATSLLAVLPGLVGAYVGAGVGTLLSLATARRPGEP
jgi:hypothetical protein